MADYSLAELSALTGLPARTIRYYIAEGLIPSPGKEGPSTRYPETTLARLRLICRLRDAHQPLATIRTRLETLSDGEIVALGSVPEKRPDPGSALDYVRSLLDGGGLVMALPVSLPRRDPDGPGVPLRAMAIDQAAPPASPASPAPPPSPIAGPAPGERSHWDRVALTPDIELHVRRPLGRPANRMVERLLAFARQLQAEEEK